MKKVLSLMLLAGMFSFYACGPSAEEKQKAEQQKQDSIAKVKTMDSLKVVAVQDSIAKVKAKAVEDSIAKAEEAKAKTKPAAAPAKTETKAAPAKPAFNKSGKK